MFINVVVVLVGVNVGGEDEGSGESTCGCCGCCGVVALLSLVVAVILVCLPCLAGGEAGG